MGINTPKKPAVDNLNPRSTREKILDAAIDLFSQRGFNGVSVREITGKVGIKESSLYNHFKSKDEILDTILGLFKSELARSGPPEEQLYQMMASMPPLEYLRFSASIFIEQMSTPTNQKIWRILALEQFYNEKAREFFLVDLVEEPKRALEMSYKIMIELGHIRVLDPEALADEYMTYTLGLFFEYLVLKYVDGMGLPEIQKRTFEHIDFFWELIKK